MTEDYISEQVRGFVHSHPDEVFCAADVSKGIKSNCKSTSRVLSQLYRKNMLFRTQTQLNEGFYYTVSNREALDNLYENYLLPYDLPNRTFLLAQITKHNFELLKADEHLPLASVNVDFLKKYDKHLLAKKSTVHFLASVVAFCLGDGHLSRSNVRFVFNQFLDVRGFIDDFKKIFRDENFIVTKSLQFQYYTVALSKGTQFGRMLKTLGVPEGNKVKQPFLVPDWVYHGSNDVKKAFLSTIIGNEGSAPSHNKWRIQFVLSKNEKSIENLLLFLNQLRAMLAHFGISTSHIQLRTQVGREFHGRFYIKKPYNIKKFHTLLGFRYASEKQDVLESLILNGKP